MREYKGIRNLAYLKKPEVNSGSGSIILPVSSVPLERLSVASTLATVIHTVDSAK